MATPLAGPRAWDRIVAYASRFTPAYRRAFLAAIDAVQGRLRRTDIVEMIRTGRIERLVDEALAATDALDDFQRIVQTSLVDAAAFTTRDINNAMRLSVRFDAYAPAAVALVQREGARLVREVRADIRATIRRVVAEGIRRGDGPRTTARVLRGSIGLTKRQQDAVRNFRRMLESGESTTVLNALTRELRDHRFDASVRRLARGDKVPAARVELMVARYEARYLKFRAETIAVHESLLAMSSGNRLAWEEAIRQGHVQRDGLERQWFTAADERTCPFCRPVHLRIAAFDEPFDTPLGATMNAPLHVRCRCVVFTRPAPLRGPLTRPEARVRQPVWETVTKRHRIPEPFRVPRLRSA